MKIYKIVHSCGHPGDVIVQSTSPFDIAREKNAASATPCRRCAAGVHQEFGVGRVPADVDPAEEALAELAAEQIQPTPAPPAGREYLVCKHCGQGGYRGAYPFSTYPSSMRTCDDCGG